MRAAVRAEKGDVKKMNFKHLVVGVFWVDWNEWHALETNGMLCCAVDHKKKMVKQRKK